MSNHKRWSPAARHIVGNTSVSGALRLKRGFRFTFHCPRYLRIFGKAAFGHKKIPPHYIIWEGKSTEIETQQASKF